MTHTDIAVIEFAGQRVPVSVTDRKDTQLGVVIASLGEYPVYDDLAYDLMGRDEVRNSAYRDAIRQLAPGRIVLDVGTGADALWAVTAARAGARHVYAVEEMVENAQLARAKVDELGLSDTITIVNSGLESAVLPEKVDLAISEIIGCIAGSEGAAAVTNDIIARFLRPGGACIPRSVSTTVGGFDLTEMTPDGITAFERDHIRYLERVFEIVGRPFDIRTCVSGIRCRTFLTDQVEVEALDLTDGTARTTGSDDRVLRVERDGCLHGLALGVRLDVAADIPVIDTTRSSTSWFPVWVPISAEGVEVVAGDRVDVCFSWTPGIDGIHPDYRITGSVHRAQMPPVEFRWCSPYHGTQFRSNEFYRTLFPEPQ